MEMNNSDDWVPISSVIDQYELLHGGEIDFFKGVELAWACVTKHIRHFRTRTLVHVAAPVAGVVALPEKAFLVTSVTGASRSYDSGRSSVLLTTGVSIPAVEGVSRGADETGAALEPVFFDITGTDYCPPGPFVDFEFRDNQVAVPAHAASVEIVFQVLEICPADGYPYVTPMTADACAAFIHKLDVAKKFYRQEVPLYTKQEAEREFHEAVAVACQGEGLSQNAMDAVLRRMTSFARKRHDQPYRPQA